MGVSFRRWSEREESMGWDSKRTLMEVQHEPPLATILMNEGKANALDAAVMRRLRDAVRQAVEAGARAAVLTGSGSRFCAGLNLPALIQLDEAGMRATTGEFLDMCADLLGAPIPVVAAINGHAVAGGCILAFCCDYRIMARGDSRIGVNEVEVGIRFPRPALDLLVAMLPPASRAEILLRGRLVGPEEAVELGMVHHLAPPELLLPSARTMARELAAKAPHAMAAIKADLNASLLEGMRRGREAAIEEFVAGWFSEATQECVRRVCDALAARRAGAG